MGCRIKVPLDYKKILSEIGSEIDLEYGSRYRFSKYSKITESTLNRMLSGKTIPSAKLLIKVLSILGYTCIK